MKDQPTQLPWDEPGWLDQATTWILATLAAQGLQPVTDIELVHQRPWSTFARMMTNIGPVYFKAPAPAFSFEAPLTQALARWRPDCTVPLLAIDLEQGWLLSAGAGITLRCTDPSTGQLEHWLNVLPHYAALQMDMAGRIPELLQLGLGDRRLAVFPHLYAELLEETDNLRIEKEPGLSAEEYQRLRNLRGQVTAWCEELAGYGIPETLTHEEVHDANVLVNGNQYIFTDWSDASVAHPFFSMLVTIRAAAHRLHLAEHGPEMMRLRDIYLEPWTKFATRKELLAAFELAYRLAMANRALSWHYGTSFLASQHKEPYADSVPGWLQDFLTGS